MLQLVFKNRVVRFFATVVFIIATVLFGFSSYTSQKMAEVAAPDIFLNPSQLYASEVAYVPHHIVDEAEASLNLHQHLTTMLTEFHQAGLFSQVVCGGTLYNEMVKNGVPAIRSVVHEDEAVHKEMSALFNQSQTTRILLIADRGYLEQGLYALGSMGGQGIGLDINHGSYSNEGAPYLARVKLYLDCELSQPSPLIANPRYTLDIQH